MAFRLQVRGALSFENACVCFYGESESETRLLGFPIAKVLLLQPKSCYDKNKKTGGYMDGSREALPASRRLCAC